MAPGSNALFSPSKIVAVGLNYRDHAAEMKEALPDRPLLFLKPSTAVIEHGEPIIYPASTSELHYEGELAVIIKTRARHVTAADASLFILGYACANDVTARDLQRLDGQWTRAKSFDTFCPLGPRIVKDIDPGHLDITTRVNGVVKQHSNTSNLIFDVPALLSYISSVMTLLPGDVIITGTPHGVGPLQAGDEVEVEIEGIGILKNRIEKEK